MFDLFQKFGETVLVIFSRLIYTKSLAKVGGLEPGPGFHARSASGPNSGTYSFAHNGTAGLCQH